MSIASSFFVPGRRLRIPEDQRAAADQPREAGRRRGGRGFRQAGRASTPGFRRAGRTCAYVRLSYPGRWIHSPAHDTYRAAADTSESADRSRRRSQSKNRAPRSLVMTRACRHVAHSPRLRQALPRILTIVHDDGMFTSEATTRGVRVSVLSEYAPDRSRPAQQQWFFLYTITITNEGAGHRAAALPPLDHHRRRRPCRGSEGPGRGRASSRSSRPASRSRTRPAARSARRSARWKAPTRWSRAPATAFDVTIAPFTLSEPYTVH